MGYGAPRLDFSAPVAHPSVPRLRCPMSSPSHGGRSADFLRARDRDAGRLPARLRRGWAALPLSPPHPFFRSRTSVPALTRSHLRFRLFFSAALSPVALSGLTFHGQRRFSLFRISPCRSAAASLFAPSARLDKRVCPLPRLRGFIPAPSYPSAAARAWSIYPCPARLSYFLFRFGGAFSSFSSSCSIP